MNNHTKDGKRTKMFEPCNVGEEPTDTCASVSEDILMTATKCHNGGRIVESIREKDFSVVTGEPTLPGALHVKSRQDKC